MTNNVILLRPPNATAPRACENWLDMYVYHQRFTESPTKFHFWTGVSTIAGALRRKCWIDQRGFKWTPNMYIILVGPAGVAAKSTSMAGGISLLDRVEAVRIGPSSATWQALLNAFQRSRETISIPGSPEPVTMSCLTIAVSELGTFFRPDNGEFTDFLTDVWDGKDKFTRETMKDGLKDIPAPWLNMIACTTPSWLKTNFPEDLIGAGLTSRIVWVYGDKKTKLVPYPAEQVPAEQYGDENLALLHDLRIIAEMAGEYKLDRSAIEWGSAWYVKLNTEAKAKHLTSGRFDGYIARKQTHLHKLAMVLAAAESCELIISSKHLQAADRYVTELEDEMVKVFESIGVSAGARATNEVVQFVHRNPGVTYQQLWKYFSKRLDPRMIQDSLTSAITAGNIKKEKLSEDDWKLTFIGGKK